MRLTMLNTCLALSRVLIASRRGKGDTPFTIQSFILLQFHHFHSWSFFLHTRSSKSTTLQEQQQSNVVMNRFMINAILAIAVLIGFALAENSTVTLFLPGLDTQSLMGSIIGSVRKSARHCPFQRLISGRTLQLPPMLSIAHPAQVAGIVALAAIMELPLLRVQQPLHTLW
jgi:hypothetical protein